MGIEYIGTITAIKLVIAVAASELVIARLTVEDVQGAGGIARIDTWLV